MDISFSFFGEVVADYFTVPLPCFTDKTLPFHQPHLHKIVNSSMELAQSAKEPYNYFLLLRALFRSIGGGSHDLLYQEFLPLLPNLLQGKNHTQHYSELQTTHVWNIVSTYFHFY